MARQTDEEFINLAKGASKLSPEEEAAIRSLERSSAQSAMQPRVRLQQDATQNLYNQIYGTQATALDAIRRSNAEAIATGASKGVQAANELSAILDLQDAVAEGATALAQEDYALADEYEAALLQGDVRASGRIDDLNKQTYTDTMAGLALKYQSDAAAEGQPTPSQIAALVEEGRITEARIMYDSLNPDASEDDWNMVLAGLAATADIAPSADGTPLTKAEAERAQKLEAFKAGALSAGKVAPGQVATLKLTKAYTSDKDQSISVAFRAQSHKDGAAISPDETVGDTKIGALPAYTGAKTGQPFLVNGVIAVKNEDGWLQIVSEDVSSNAVKRLKRDLEGTPYNLGGEKKSKS